MPDAWRVFFRGRQLRPVQQEAAAPLLRGESVLLSGPTASGKTEAVLAPLYQRHVSFQRTRVGVVYVAPTKALVNDMFERLTGYFAGGTPDIVQRYTGDHHQFGGTGGAVSAVGDTGSTGFFAAHAALAAVRGQSGCLR